MAALRRLLGVTTLDHTTDLHAADAAETGRLRAAIDSLLPSLERFARFADQDRAARDRPVWQAELERPLPAEGAGLDQLLQELAEVVVPHGERIGAPGFSGWVVNAPTTAGIATSLAANVAGSQRWSVQSFNYLEELGLRWLAELLELPAAWQGVFVSGGSIANLIGLGAARQQAYEALGVDPARDGIAGAPPLRVYASEEVHHCVLRAAGVLGIGRRNVVTVPSHAPTAGPTSRRCARAVEADRRRGLVPMAVVASAGTVNTGVVDPISELADLAEEHGSWLHVDGAYGLLGPARRARRAALRGLERAGSVVVDPHKWLAVPVGVGAAFVRDRGVLGRAFTQEAAAYIEGAVRRGARAGLAVRLARDPVPRLHPRAVRAVARRARVGHAPRDRRRRDARPGRAPQRLRPASRSARRGGRAARARPPSHALDLLLPLRRAGSRRAGPRRAERPHRRRLRADGLVTSRRPPRSPGRYVIRPCFVNPRSTAEDVDVLAREVRRHGDALTAAG